MKTDHTPDWKYCSLEQHAKRTAEVLELLRDDSYADDLYIQAAIDRLSNLQAELEHQALLHQVCNVPRVATKVMIDAVRENDVDLVRDGFDSGIQKLWRAMCCAAIAHGGLIRNDAAIDAKPTPDGSAEQKSGA